MEVSAWDLLIEELEGRREKIDAALAAIRECRKLAERLPYGNYVGPSPPVCVVDISRCPTLISTFHQ
jgi:hypothetical protein